MFPLTENSNIQFMVCAPFVSKRDNHDYMDFTGLGYVNYNIRTRNEKFVFAFYLMKRSEWGTGFNAKVEASYKIPFFTNQYVFMQFYTGYAESMLNYKIHHNALRIGLSIKPDFFSLY